MYQTYAALLQPFILLFLLLLFYIILRSERLAAFVLWALAALALGLTKEAPGVPCAALALPGHGSCTLRASGFVSATFFPT